MLSTSRDCIYILNKKFLFGCFYCSNVSGLARVFLNEWNLDSRIFSGSLFLISNPSFHSHFEYTLIGKSDIDSSVVSQLDALT